MALLASCGGTAEFIESRPKLPSCGRYTLVGPSSTAERREMNQEITCILEAVGDGRPAELIVTVPGEHGGSATTYFRVLGRNQVELFVDNTDLGERPSHSICSDLRRSGEYLSGTGCRSIALTRRLSPATT